MIKRLVSCGLLAAVATAVSALERFVPLQAVIPLPGLKLGLANCIILFALIKLDFKSAFAVLLCKSLVVSLLFTGLTSFVYSFLGGILALVGMYALLRFNGVFSLCGVSVAGAALFNFGQIAVAALMLGSFHIFSYLPILLIASVFTGIITGFITYIIDRNVQFRWL